MSMSEEQKRSGVMKTIMLGDDQLEVKDTEYLTDLIGDALNDMGINPTSFAFHIEVEYDDGEEEKAKPYIESKFDQILNNVKGYTEMPEFNVAMDHVINSDLAEDNPYIFHPKSNLIEKHERLHREAAAKYLTNKQLARRKRSDELRKVAVFIGGIGFGASTVGMCVIGSTATTWTLPVVATLGCFAASLGLILMGSITYLSED